MYIAAGQGQTTPGDKNFDVNRNLLSLASFATSFQKIYLKSDFIHIFSCFYTYTIALGYISFHDLINVYSRSSGADNPWEKTDVISNSCHLGHLLQV